MAFALVADCGCSFISRLWAGVALTNTPNQLLISCSPLGSDLQCSAVATDQSALYICKLINETVTDQTTWTSSNPSVAAFEANGFLKVLATGRVQVNAQFQNLSSSVTFNVAPGVPAERITNLNVSAESALGYRLSRGTAMHRVLCFFAVTRSV